MQQWVWWAWWGTARQKSGQNQIFGNVKLKV
jgi:hypothetical protein